MVNSIRTGPESQRLNCLHRYAILDSKPEEAFDGIAQLAAQICNAPIAFISFLDADRQWFKSQYGFEFPNGPRESSFCSYTIQKPFVPLQINDVRKDPRFQRNQWMNPPFGIVSYTGVPLSTKSGFALGTLAIADRRPRKLNRRQVNALQTLAAQTMKLLDLQMKVKELQQTQTEMEKAYKDLSKYSYAVSHDLKAPLIGIQALADMIKENYSDQLDSKGNNFLDLMSERAVNLKELVSAILKIAQLKTVSPSDIEEFSLEDLLNEIIVLISPPKDTRIILADPLPNIKAYKYGLTTILHNLLTNAFKYNDKPHPHVQVLFAEDRDFYHIAIQDNGKGIPKKFHETIFLNFQTLGIKDRYNKKGTGIGLALVKELAEKMGGTIHLQSEVGAGSTFTVSIPK